MADVFPTAAAPLGTGANTRLRLVDLTSGTLAYVTIRGDQANALEFNVSPTVTKYETYVSASAIPGTRKVVTGNDCNIHVKTAGPLSDPGINLLVTKSETGAQLGFEFTEPNGIVRRGVVIVPPYKPMTPVRGIYELDFTLEVDGEYDFVMPA